MGRGAIPSRRGFSRGCHAAPRGIRYYPSFRAAIPGEGAGSPRVTQPFATRFPPERGAVRLACVRRAASVHPEPGSNSPSKICWASSPSGPLSHADRFRSIHMVLFDRKRNFSGPPLGGLAKNNPSQTISNGSMSARMRPSEVSVHPRSIRFSRCTPARSIRFDRAARQGDILPDRRGLWNVNSTLHKSYTIYRLL